VNTEDPDTPRIAGNTPAAVDLEKGKTYYFCTCGRSQKQPFCDGAHKNGTGFKSLAFTAVQDGQASLCMCKNSKKIPFCDGTHHSLCG
jgi:CDGSH-type Zn-finger protein